VIKGWEVEYQDGIVLREWEGAKWLEIPKIGIKRLSLYWNGKSWHLTGKKNYFQKKHASVVPGVPNSFRLESRMIGFYDNNGNKVIFEVNEFTGEMRMKVE